MGEPSLIHPFNSVQRDPLGLKPPSLFYPYAHALGLLAAQLIRLISVAYSNSEIVHVVQRLRDCNFNVTQQRRGQFQPSDE